jgi:hypothetical protein
MMAARELPVVKCDRCRRRLRNRRLDTSVAFTSEGTISAFVCGDCLTPAEYIDSELLAAIHEVAITPDGLILSRPKYRRTADS